MRNRLCSSTIKKLARESPLSPLNRSLSSRREFLGLLSLASALPASRFLLSSKTVAAASNSPVARNRAPLAANAFSLLDG
jgi:hypothetical protein